MSVKQRSILNHANNTISVRFGFLGLGMGGCSIAAACADVSTNTKNIRYPYTGLLVNTNQIDLNKIKPSNPNTEKLLIGDGKGAGRNIGLGEKMFKEDNNTLERHFKERFEQTEFVWIVAGLGGGTGTGSVIQAIKLVMENGFNARFGLILTLPRFAEGETVINNALERLNQINKAMKGLGSIILVDNEKLYDHFSNEKPNSSVSESLEFTNKFVADTLHELNVVTASYEPHTSIHFDTSEFLNLIKTPGILHLARFSAKSSEIDSAQPVSYIGKLKRQIDSGVLSDGYDLTQSSRLAVSILANQSAGDRLFNYEFGSSIENLINEISPLAKEKPIAQYTYPNGDTQEVYFYSVFAGLYLPKRVPALLNESKRLAELRESNKKVQEDIFADFSVASEESESTSFDQLFGEPANEKKPLEKSNDFEALFGK